MSLQRALDYRTRDPNALQRALQRAGSSTPGAWLMSHLLKPIDRAVHRMSGGRRTATGVIAGLPVIMLTTTGAKTGVRRTSPLLAVPCGDDLAVIGSNYGGQATPGWVFNLESDPRATVSHGDRTADALARPADAAEYDAVFAAGGRIYPGFPKYRERAAHRAIRVFVLTLAV